MKRGGKVLQPKRHARLHALTMICDKHGSVDSFVFYFHLPFSGAGIQCGDHICLARRVYALVHAQGGITALDSYHIRTMLVHAKAIIFALFCSMINAHWLTVRSATPESCILIYLRSSFSHLGPVQYCAKCIGCASGRLNKNWCFATVIWNI